MSNVERLEEWLEAEQYPDAIWSSMKGRKNYHLLGQLSMNNSVLTYDCIEAAKSADGTYRSKLVVHGTDGEKPFTIEYTISDVVITVSCGDDHDFGEWRYDYMGGDLRNCKVCGKTEFI